MLTRPLNDFRCLTLILYVVQERLGDAAIRGWAESFGSLPAYVSDLRALPQFDDLPGVLMDAPRVACAPPQRLRFNAKDPACCERSADYLTVAEVLDPGTPRTLITIRVGGQMHVLPVECLFVCRSADPCPDATLSPGTWHRDRHTYATGSMKGRPADRSARNESRS